jgi:hypothetical protein
MFNPPEPLPPIPTEEVFSFFLPTFLACVVGLTISLSGLTILGGSTIGSGSGGGGGGGGEGARLGIHII